MIWDDLWRSRPGAFHHWPVDSLVRWAVTLPSGSRVLDLGCGAGNNLWALADMGHDAVGVDVSPTALAHGRDYLATRGTRTPLVAADILRLPWPHGSFDAACDVQAIQHTPAAEVAYREVARVLRPGGQFFSMHLDPACDWKEAYPDVGEVGDPRLDLLAEHFAVSVTRLTRSDSRTTLAWMLTHAVMRSSSR